MGRRPRLDGVGQGTSGKSEEKRVMIPGRLGFHRRARLHSYRYRVRTSWSSTPTITTTTSKTPGTDTRTRREPDLEALGARRPTS